jgi:hypothetical protein
MVCSISLMSGEFTNGVLALVDVSVRRRIRTQASGALTQFMKRPTVSRHCKTECKTERKLLYPRGFDVVNSDDITMD